MRRYLLAFLCCAAIGCKSKPALTSEDLDYIRTTLDLMRTRTSLPGGTDSLQVRSKLDEVYARHRTSKAKYLARTGELAEDPKRTELIYNAIRDSLGIKT